MYILTYFELKKRAQVIKHARARRCACAV